jgi:uncharacterized protein YjbJ (UPF0337 family)
MNTDILAGKWKQLAGKAKEKWGQLTDNDLTEVDGRAETLAGKLQERYGWAKERAHEEINRWVSGKDNTP